MRRDLPRALADVRLSDADMRDVAAKVKLRRIRGKGLGLVARVDLPADTRIGVYGGKVFDAKDYSRAPGRGKYSVDFFARDPATGAVREGLTLDPGALPGGPRHANVLAAFINEPAPGQRPNVVWVRNYTTNGMELWTATAVRRGEELTACYAPAYPRGYDTPCTRRPGYLHVVRRGMRRPRPA